MSVNDVQRDITKIIVIEERLEPVRSGLGEQKTLIFTVAFSVVGAIIVLLVLICLCKRRKRRRRIRKGREVSSNSTISTTSSPVYSIPTAEVQLRTTADVTKRYERSISSVSTKSQVYLVPFAVLPPDFDFSSREVEVKADYVILKDLSLLERYNSTENGGIVNEAYEPQQPYNPQVYGTIPPLIREPYKKQPSYNPTFY